MQIEELAKMANDLAARMEIARMLVEDQEKPGLRLRVVGYEDPAGAVYVNVPRHTPVEVLNAEEEALIVRATRAAVVSSCRRLVAELAAAGCEPDEDVAEFLAREEGR